MFQASQTKESAPEAQGGSWGLARYSADPAAWRRGRRSPGGAAGVPSTAARYPSDSRRQRQERTACLALAGQRHRDSPRHSQEAKPCLAAYGLGIIQELRKAGAALFLKHTRL